ncbi:MAG: hypothetical protein KGI66_04990, partial [Patescibacteria group bacterium]|nr:hypothetical protein [Patescibacteria group bacterium]
MEITNIAAIVWVVAIINLAIGFFVYTTSRTASARAFLWAVAAHAGWESVIGFYISMDSPAGATLFVKVAYFTGLIVSAAFGFFFFTYPNREKKLTALTWTMFISTLIFGYITFLTDLDVGQAFYIGGIAHWGWHFGILWPVFPVLFFGWFMSGLFTMLYNGLHSSDKNSRSASLFIFWGMMIMVTVPAIVNIVLPQLGMFSLLWLGPILNSGWIIFLGYAIIKYEALNIQIVAKRAFLYAVVVSGITLITVSLNFAVTYLTSNYPSFPTWFVYMVTALLIAGLGYFIWLKLRESDTMKYEFITTATHKFRTPLTHIKWATENLAKEQSPEDRAVQLSYIQEANNKLVELTNLLVNESSTENGDYEYKLEDGSLSDAVTETLASVMSQSQMRKVAVDAHIAPGLRAEFDSSRIRFIIQTFIENAINYTPDGGTVTVSLAASP